jgi:ribosomal protein S18 acetylase RimI-like enzyme
MMLVAAYIADEAGSCYITSVSLISEFTRKGIARTLLYQVAAHARRHHLPETGLEVASKASRSCACVQRGFQHAEDRDDRGY